MAEVGRAYFVSGQGEELPSFYTKAHVESLKPDVNEPKNLVLIYGESFERTYFDERLFPGLTPELRKLEDNSLSFTNIHQLPGTGWTIGGMVASQCGVPLVASSGGNSMEGLNKFLPGAYCLGDVLADWQYRLNFIGGADVDFAGKGDFYRTHGFDKVDGVKTLGKKTPDADYRNAWGLHDDTTFSFVKDRFLELASNEEPFALVTLTLGTHHPDGFLSKGCKERPYENGEEPMLNAVHCSNRMIADLVDFIMQSDYADNTLVVVLSDHLAMNNSVSDQLDKGKRRDLFMVHEAGLEADKVSRPGSTLDVAPTILSLMGFKVQELGLGRSLLGSEKNFVENNSEHPESIRDLYAGIKSLWMFPSLEDGVSLDAENNKIKIADQEFGLPLLLKLNKDYNIDDVLVSEELYKHLDVIGRDSPFAWFDQCQTFDFSEQSADSEGVCVFHAQGSHNVGAVKAYGQRQSVELSFNDFKKLFSEAADKRSDASIAERFSSSALGGHVVVNGDSVGADDYQDVLADLKGHVTLKAVPLADKKFVKWKGVDGDKKYRKTISLKAHELLASKEPLALVAPVFDNNVSSTTGRPAFRSAWAGIASKENGVIASFLSPGNTDQSIARLARPLAGGVDVDIRSVGGFTPANQDHYINVAGENVEKPGRGLKLVILDASGDVISSKLYDTHASKEESQALMTAIDAAEPDSLLIFATQDEFTRSMTPGLLNALEELGFAFE